MVCPRIMPRGVARANSRSWAKITIFFCVRFLSMVVSVMAMGILCSRMPARRLWWQWVCSGCVVGERLSRSPSRMACMQRARVRGVVLVRVWWICVCSWICRCPCASPLL